MAGTQAQQLQGRLHESLVRLSEKAGQSSSQERIALVHATAPYFAQLRAISRRTNDRARTGKRKVSEARAQVDVVSLTLQNLKYQKRHLEDEIRQCRDFRSVYQTVALVELEDFKANASEQDRTDEVLNDPHALQLARLRFELSERKRLEEEKRSIQTQKALLLKENTMKKRRLEGLESDLKDMLSGSVSVRRRFEEAEEERKAKEEIDSNRDMDLDRSSSTPNAGAQTPLHTSNAASNEK